MTEQQTTITADNAERKSRFVNSARLATVGDEIVFDFFHILDHSGILQGRFSFSPGHAKRLARVLAEHLSIYEKQFGPIKESPEPPGQIGFRPD